MKINSILKKLLYRGALAATLTVAFLPTLHAEDATKTYEYTPANWDDSADYTHVQNGSDKHHVIISNVDSPDAEVRGATAGGTAMKADGHYVSVSDSVLKSVYGGHHTVINYDGQYTGSGNTVIIKNSVIGEVSGGDIATGAANNNVVILEDTIVNGSVCGGYVMWGGEACNNQIIIRSINKKIDLSHTTINGGIPGSGSNVSFNNTVTLEGYQGNVKDIRYVSAITLTLTNWNPNEYVLTVTGNRTDLTGVAVTVNMESIAADAALPGVGDELKLISGANGDKINLTMGKTTGVKQGISKVYDFEISTTGGTATVASIVSAKVQNVYLNPQTKALAEGRVAAMTLNHQAGNLVAEQGIHHAEHALSSQGNNKGVAAFVAVSGAHNKVESGSHVEVDGVASMLGVAASPLKGRGLTLGGFVESGWGQYRSFNSFADAAAVRAEGESSYCGGGVLARYALRTARTRGPELNASLRAGRQKSDFGSLDLRDGFGNCASYDVDSPYLAGHLGMSYTRELKARLNATVYARYLWSRIGSADTHVCGDAVHLDALTSNRLRFGARATWKNSERWQTYVGGAFEWECSGTAHAMTQGMGIEAPSMRGGSGIGEVGAIWQPKLTRPLWLDGALQGSVGRNEGFGARLGCSIAF